MGVNSAVLYFTLYQTPKETISDSQQQWKWEVKFSSYFIHPEGSLEKQPTTHADGTLT
jgi:hypothetical protein